MTVRFGAFEVDLANAELRKNGLPLRLQEQPFKVLEALLEQPGEVVAREELVRRLWPDGTFVDFDRGLNAAVTRLRQALTDSAENPRYVETVARRGYRFIAPVHASGGEEDPPPAPLEVPRQERRFWAPAGLALVATIAIAATGWWVLSHRNANAEKPLIPLPLTSEPGNERCASLSPDGHQVAFDWDQGGGKPHIFIKVVGPGDPLRLTTGSEAEFGPAWSPDGRSIAFIRRLTEAKVGVFLISALGGAERKLTEFVFEERLWRGDYRWLDWARDSKRLIVTGTDQIGLPVGLFLVSVDGAERRRLTNFGSGNSFEDTSPAVSPNGRIVAFARGLPMTRFAESDLYTLEVSEDFRPVGEPRRLTSGSHSASPAWTVDGRELVFSSRQGIAQSLWRISLELGAVPRKALMGSDGYFPAIQGGLLVYSRGSRDTNIWRQELPSGKDRAEAPVSVISSTAEDTSAQYSPDGTRIAFQSERSGYTEIWLCGSDGGHCVQLTSFNGPHTGSPHWSPDGKRIAFDSAVSGRFNIYVVDANGGVAHRVTSGSAVNAIPGWSRDGNWIYFMSMRTGESEVWKVASGGGAETQITHKGGFTAFESPDGKSLYYTKSSVATKLWKSRVDGSGEVEVLDAVAFRGFVVTPDRIYYLRPETGGLTTLRSFVPATGANTVIASIKKPMGLGLSLSLDGKHILYCQVDQDGSDLMLVDGFR